MCARIGSNNLPFRFGRATAAKQERGLAARLLGRFVPTVSSKCSGPAARSSNGSSSRSRREA